MRTPSRWWLIAAVVFAALVSMPLEQPRADAPNDVDPDLVDGKALLGMRVPVVVAC